MQFNHLEPFSEIDGVPILLSKDRSVELAENGYAIAFQANTGQKSVILAEELFELCDAGAIRAIAAHRIASLKLNHVFTNDFGINLSQSVEADKEVALLFGVTSSAKNILFDYKHSRKWLWRQQKDVLHKVVSQVLLAIFETKRLFRLFFA